MGPFDVAKIKELIKKNHNNKPVYVIGTDTYDKNCLTYMLCRKTETGSEVILSKKMGDESAFNEEVNNLSKYFDAPIWVESVKQAN
jgi:hypothetical protein